MRRARVLFAGMAVALAASHAPVAEAHVDGYHHMVIWKTNPTYGVQRKTEVTNPNMSSNTSQHHFVAPLWWTPDSSSDWAEVGWTELSPDIGDQWIYSWTTANQWARYPYPIDHGMQIRYAIVPMDGLCGPTETGCVVALKLYWGGDWVLLAMANQLGSNHETVSMGYEWYGATAFHGEVAGAPGVSEFLCKCVI